MRMTVFWSSSTKPRRGKCILLASVGTLALLGTGVAGFLVSPWNHLYPVPGMAASARPIWPPQLAFHSQPRSRQHRSSRMQCSRSVFRRRFAKVPSRHRASQRLPRSCRLRTQRRKRTRVPVNLPVAHRVRPRTRRVDSQQKAERLPLFRASSGCRRSWWGNRRRERTRSRSRLQKPRRTRRQHLHVPNHLKARPPHPLLPLHVKIRQPRTMPLPKRQIQ